ncbi:MAG: transglycosylase SLT domain-containing protein [Hydrogenothermaceae bacterium]|nr:transglycosylase SLT domain-containing protein [Hydrogenothermaceae bacterium]
MYIKLLLTTFILVFLSSCSVTVKDSPKNSYTKKEYKSPHKVTLDSPKQTPPSNNSQQLNSKNIDTNPEDGSQIAKLINYQLNQEEKNFLLKEAFSLNIKIPDDEDIEYFLNYYTTTKKYFTENAFNRANYFLPMVKRVFREEGLPEELAYLAVVESGFNPYATSPSNAAGIWQFIPSTGKRFGLRIDEYIDERRDPYKSTVAAAKYLKTLYNMFGSWELAIAGYNCGEKCIQKRAEITGSYNFSDIKYALPKETMEYVPRFFAVLLISKNPAKYGININSNIYDVLTLPADREVNIEDYASENKIDVDILKFYNAHLKRGIAFQGVNINIPKLDITFNKKYIYLPPAPVKTATIKQPNPDTTKPEFPKKEDNIILTIMNKEEPKKEEKLEIVKTATKSHLYKVEKGDTLYSIARKFGTTVEAIKRLNRLESENISPGDILIIGE